MVKILFLISYFIGFDSSKLCSFAFKTNISDYNRYGKISPMIVMSTFIAPTFQFEGVSIV